MKRDARGSPVLAGSSKGPVVLVASVGAATGSRAAAAALACAGSEPDRAALLIDLTGSRRPRPSLIATSGAREFEERVAAHMPEAAVASRGAICQLNLAADESAIEQVAAALPLARESAAVIHPPPSLLQAMLGEPRIEASGALLVADLAEDRPLTALVVRGLLDRGLRVAVLKRPLGWFTARCAFLGVLPVDGPALPARLAGRLLQQMGVL
jgi:hypothetical protein